MTMVYKNIKKTKPIMKLLDKIIFGAMLLLPVQGFACTSLIAGKNATADGSVLVTYAADSHTLYGELYNRQGGIHKSGEMRKIFV